MKTPEIVELEEMLAGAQLEEENLRSYIAEIAALIYFEAPLEDQDNWFLRMVDLGYYRPISED